MHATKSRKIKAVITAALAGLALTAAGCSTSGSSSSATSKVSGSSVELDTDSCPAESTDALGDGDDILIGTSLALSGPVAAAGQDTVPVIKGYFKMVNDQGGIDGHKLKLIAKDDAYEAARAVTNVKGLLEDDKVMATMLQLGTAQSTAVQQMHEKLCVPQLYVSSGAPNFYDPASHPFSTSNFFPYSANGTLMVQFLDAKFPQGAKVGELIWNNDFGATASKAFDDAAKDSNVQIVAQVEHSSSAVSLSSQVTQLLSKSPDALVASTGSSFCSQFIGTARSKGFGGPILLPYACSDASDVLAPLGDKAENVYAAQSLIDPNNPTGESAEAARAYLDFLKKYAPGADTHSSFVALGYQMSALLVDQLKRTADSDDGLSRVALVDAVWSTDTDLGLNFPGHGTLINGEFPYPTGYAVMSSYDPAAKAWQATDSAILASGEQP